VTEPKVIDLGFGESALVRAPVAPTPPEPPEPPEPEPPTGNVHRATSTAEVMALLKRKDLGVQPTILVPSGTVLGPMSLDGSCSGESNSNRKRIKADGAILDANGSNRGFAYRGVKYLDVEGLAFRNGNFTQNGIVTFGDSQRPPSTKGVAFRRCSHDKTCTGPARASSGTNEATAHFFYMAECASGESQDGITIEDNIGHADDRGLAAFLHFYTHSAGSPITNFVARRNTAYGYTQAVMAWAGGLKDAVIEDFNGIDCYTVYRLKYGSGRLIRPKSSHPGSGNKTNPLYEKGSGWSIDSVAGLN
jgi:hypothetical protein